MERVSTVSANAFPNSMPTLARGRLESPWGISSDWAIRAQSLRGRRYATQRKVALQATDQTTAALLSRFDMTKARSFAAPRSCRWEGQASPNAGRVVAPRAFLFWEISASCLNLCTNGRALTVRAWNRERITD
jgi:hypothetical protein